MNIRSIVGKQTINTMTIAVVALAIFGAVASSAKAGNIIWVTEEAAVPTAWLNLLTSAGHTVQGYTSSEANPDPAVAGAPFTVAQLTAADLIVCDGSNDSGGIGDKFSTWKSITAPLINMGVYSVDGGDWLWFGGNITDNALSSGYYLGSDPVWGGTINPTTTAIFATKDLAGTAFGSNGGGGAVVASVTEGGNIQIARWIADSDAGVGPRMYFGGSDMADKTTFHLSTEGEAVFLNAVDNFINPPSAPSLTSLVPADDEQDVLISGDLVVGFNMPMQTNTGFIRLYKSDDKLVESFDVAILGQITVDDTTVTIDPTANLIVGTEYYVQIDTTALEAAADGSPFAGITNTTDWSFTTDGTSPSVASSFPEDDAMILPTTELVVTFNEDVAVGSGNITVHLTSDDSIIDTIDVSTVSISGSEVTLTLNVALVFGTEYYVTAPSGAFTDLSGNVWTGITDTTEWSFITIGANSDAIVWVTAARDGVVPQDWKNFLTAEGYTVVGFSGDLTLTAAQQASLNMAKLVIYDNSNGSAQAGSATEWNGLTVSLLHMSVYGLDEWGWAHKDNGNIGTPVTATDPNDAVWDGITLTNGTTTENWYNKTSVGTPGEIYLGGNIVADDGVDSVIIRWDEKAVSATAGKRMFFACTVAGTGLELTDLGKDIFLNAVKSMLPQPPAGTVIIIM